MWVLLSGPVPDEAYSLTLDQVAQFAAGARGTLMLVLTDTDAPRRGRLGHQVRIRIAMATYDPQDSQPLGTPNGNVAADDMMVTLSSMVAGAVTNPFGYAYYCKAGDSSEVVTAAGMLVMAR